MSGAEVAERAPVPLAEIKAYLRIANSEEDALLAGTVRGAAAMCEAFTGLVLITRRIEERAMLSGAWTRLSASPVRAIEGVEAAGSEAALAAEDYAIDIDANGDGWVRAMAGPSTGSGQAAVVVRYTAGLGEDWNAVPEPLRQGVTRLAAHLFTTREGDDAAPPAAVTALWRPWRRLPFGFAQDRRTG